MVYSLKVSKCAITGETCVFYPHHYSLFSEYRSFFPVVVIRLFRIPHLYSYSFLVLSFLSFFFSPPFVWLLWFCVEVIWCFCGHNRKASFLFFFSVSLFSFFSITLSYASPIFQFELFSLFNMLAVIWIVVMNPNIFCFRLSPCMLFFFFFEELASCASASASACVCVCACVCN